MKFFCRNVMVMFVDMDDPIEKQEVKLLVEKTPKAIHLFNNVNERKAGLFHLTC